jgi:hypothetical protein
MRYTQGNEIRVNNGTKVIEYFRIDNCTNGNPRYVIHFLELLSDDISNNNELSITQKFDIALKNAKKVGGKKYTANWFGGGIVISSYSLQSDLEFVLSGGK